MLRYLFILLLFINISYAEAKRYFIQLGSFQDQRLLEQNINRIPKNLRSHIVVVKSNHWLIPFAYHTPNRIALQRKLWEYKRYFPDAIVSSSSYILNHRVVLNYVQQPNYSSQPRIEQPNIIYSQPPRAEVYQPTRYIEPESTIVYHPEVDISSIEVYNEERTTPPLIESSFIESPLIRVPQIEEEKFYNRSIDVIEENRLAPVITTPLPIISSSPSISSSSITYAKKAKLLDKVVIPTPKIIDNPANIKRYHYFSTKMLSGQEYYLAYKAKGDNPNLLIKVKFGVHRVSYQPVIGDMKMVDANYVIFNKRLYMYVDTFSEEGAYSKIESQHRDHILVSSWSGGKKLNTLRYYFRISDAKRYLNVEQSSDKLSEAIEEGLEYDWGLDL